MRQTSGHRLAPQGIDAAGVRARGGGRGGEEAEPRGRFKPVSKDDLFSPGGRDIVSAQQHRLGGWEGAAELARASGGQGLSYKPADKNRKKRTRGTRVRFY